jgi:hypothetical protein
MICGYYPATPPAVNNDWGTNVKHSSSENTFPSFQRQRAALVGNVPRLPRFSNLPALAESRPREKHRVRIPLDVQIASSIR